MTTLIALGAALISLIWGVARAIRWWNLPKVAEERRKRAEARQQGRTDRARIRAERRGKDALSRREKRQGRKQLP